MSGGGGTNTTVSQNSPPPQFLAAYQNVVNQAQNVASTPYTPYPGQVVAGFSPDQLAGMQGVENAQGIANPYINSAANFIGNATTPLLPQVQPTLDQAAGHFNAATTPLWGSVQQFGPGAVNQYESPYTQQVVQATQAQFNNQNAQQQNQLMGSAASAGALGGDRLGVAQGIMAGQQQLAQAPVIAGLENQGYSQALQEFNQQQQAQLAANQATAGLNIQAGQGIAGLGGQELGAAEANAWLNSQAGFGMANLGQEAYSTALGGANSLLGIGSLQQQQAQAGLNVPYEQWQAAQAYPFQTTGWLANVAEGAGGAAGGTGTTTTPAPSVGSQIGGSLLGGVGILGATGAFGSSGWLSGLGSGGGAAIDSGVWDSRGGPVHRAAGGPVGAGIPDLSLSVVPGGTGLGAVGQHAPGIAGRSLMAPSGTTSTTTGGGGGIGSILLPAAMIATHFLKGGGRVGRAPGGIVPQLPTNGASFGPEGLPQLPIVTHGAGIAGAGGLPTLNAYLAGQQAGARPLSAIPKPAAQAAAGQAPGQAAPLVPGTVTAGAPGTIVDRNGVAQPIPFGNSPMDPYGNVSAAEDEARGGRLHYADGGAYGIDLPMSDDTEPPPEPLPGAGVAPSFSMPDTGQGSGIAAAEAGPATGPGGIPLTRSAQDMPQGSGIAGPVAGTHPVIRVRPHNLHPASDRAPLSAGLPLPPPQAAAPTQAEDTGAPASHSDAIGTPPAHANPWLALAEAGFATAAGRSPNALQNLGAGLLAGSRSYESSDKAAQALAARVDETKARLAETQAYHEANEAIANRRADTGEQRAQTYAMLSGANAQKAEAMAMAAMARASTQHATSGDAMNAAINSLKGQTNPETGQPWTQADAYRHITGADWKQANAQASLDLRRQVFQATVAQHGIQNDRNAQNDVWNRINRMTDEQIRMLNGSKDLMGKPTLTPETAADQVNRMRSANAGNAHSPQGAPDTLGPPQDAISYLLKNPSLAGDFDAKYGAGAAQRYLGQ